ncbi:MAG: MFS transporter [Alphaproteobacteria bacterium]
MTRAQSFAILTTTIALGIVQTILFAALPPAGLALGLTPFQIGTFVAATNFVALVFSPYWGRKADSVGRRPLILMGLGFLAMSFLATALIIEVGLRYALGSMLIYGLLLVARISAAAYAAAAFPALKALTADLTKPEDRGTGMAAISGGFFIGTILGPIVAAFALVAGLSAPFIIAALVCTTAYFLVLSKLDSGFSPKTKETAAKLSPFDKRVSAYLAMYFLTTLSLAILQQICLFYVRDKFAVQPGAEIIQGSSALVVLALSVVGAQLILIKLLNLSPTQMIRIGAPISLIAISSLLFVDTLSLFMLSFAISGVGLGLLFPGILASSSLSVRDDEQGSLGGLQNATTSLAYMVGPLLATGFYSPSSTLPFGFACAAIAVAASFALKKSRTSPSEIN